MASGNDMRVGDAEREAAAAELREHYASGRLTLDELNERIDKAFAAKTRGDLNVLMTDLPSRRPAGAPGTPEALGAGPSGAGGPFGTGGPFGPSGPFGPGGILGAFGFGTARPIGIVLILAAFGLLRRLFFRRRAGGCGPRGRRRW
jgi:hypothetical protein